ncbi:MAG TPA: alcohol dehydrogenase catalytic domain-containing protein, partial [Gemmatimonadaceae bacterium]|nr:alcohol dehydrogenase catalytic domain-containing protein [Gemmatimonadaceae bacterium]
MKAIRIHTPGGREVMRLEGDVPTPRPADGQALVRIEAAGVNFIDVYHRTGEYKLPLPFTLGREAGGVVEALGPGAESAGVRVGDRVAYEGWPGAYAEY